MPACDKKRGWFSLGGLQAASRPGLREAANPPPAPSLLPFPVSSARKRQGPGRTLFKLCCSVLTEVTEVRWSSLQGLGPWCMTGPFCSLTPFQPWCIPTTVMSASALLGASFQPQPQVGRPTDIFVLHFQGGSRLPVCWGFPLFSLPS